MVPRILDNPKDSDPSPNNAMECEETEAGDLCLVFVLSILPCALHIKYKRALMF